MAETVQFVGKAGKFKSKFTPDKGKKFQLIWGDAVRIDDSGVVRARSRKGSQAPAHLVPTGLLEIYVIDVGQGDGVLMRTPDDKWHLIDAGTRNENQQLKKGAPNFLRWKFLNDLGRDRIELESLILTHPDLDHFGGMIDLFSKKLIGVGSQQERTFELEVENFYHCGMGRFAAAPVLGKMEAGTVAPFPMGNHGIKREGEFITELLTGKTSFKSPARAFTDDFKDLAKGVGSIPKTVKRLDTSTPFLPGYAPADNKGCTIQVLGPVVETTTTGKKGLRKLGGDSITRNGHSIVLRVDCGNARILLTGDLNTKSQKLLLSYIPESEFAVDVAKGCHHGADDIDLGFVKAMAVRATVVSSGDNENFAHPRPRVLGASARYGREGVDENGKTSPPLLYSTELARSVSLTYPKTKTFKLNDQNPATPARVNTADIEWNPPGPIPEKGLDVTPLAIDLVYGLVNVRTDGSEILLATLEESGSDFDVRVMQAGVTGAP
jgi:beta-lactamase superfamily II metal-dependent hydrolase